MFNRLSTDRPSFVLRHNSAFSTYTFLTRSSFLSFCPSFFLACSKRRDMLNESSYDDPIVDNLKRIYLRVRRRCLRKQTYVEKHAWRARLKRQAEEKRGWGDCSLFSRGFRVVYANCVCEMGVLLFIKQVVVCVRVVCSLVRHADSYWHQCFSFSFSLRSPSSASPSTSPSYFSISSSCIKQVLDASWPPEATLYHRCDERLREEETSKTPTRRQGQGWCMS